MGGNSDIDFIRAEDQNRVIDILDGIIQNWIEIDDLSPNDLLVLIDYLVDQNELFFNYINLLNDSYIVFSE